MLFFPCVSRRLPGALLLLAALLAFSVPAQEGTARAAESSSAKKPAFLPLSPPETKENGLITAPIAPSVSPLELAPVDGSNAGKPLGKNAPAPGSPRVGSGVPSSVAGGGPAAVAPPASDARSAELARRGIVRVELRPSRPFLLSSPFAATLSAVEIQDGDLVSEGQVLARFDARNVERELEEARQALASALEQVQNAQDKSAQEQEQAQAALARQADNVREVEERLSQTALAAPFQGRVVDVRAFAGQHLRRGDAVAELSENGDIEIVSTVPSAWISRLAPGHIIWVYVEETAKSYEAEFVRFGGKVDTATRSIRAYAKFITGPDELLPGMSGRADFFPKRSR